MMCFRAERGGNGQKRAETGTPKFFGTKMMQVRVLSLRPILIKVDSKRISLNFLCFFARYQHFCLYKALQKQGFVLKLQREYKVTALPKNTENQHFRPLPGNEYLLPSTNISAVNEHFCRQRTLLPSTNTENITGYEFKGVFTIEEFYGIMP